MQRSSAPTRLSASFATWLALAGGALAFDAPRPASPELAALAGPAAELPALASEDWQAERAARDPALAALSALAARPGSWLVRYDARTDRPYLIVEGGSAAGPVTAAPLELARDFLARTRGLHGIPAAELVHVPEASSSLMGGKLEALLFERRIAGIPVEGSGATLAVSSGRVRFARFERLAEPEGSARAVLAAGEALARLGAEHAELLASLEPAAPPALVWFPIPAERDPGRVEPGPGGYVTHLAWKLMLGDGERSFQAFVDAETGVIHGLAETTLQLTEGQVSADVFARSPRDPVESRPLGNLGVAVGASVVATDGDGRYSAPEEGEVTFELESPSEVGGFDVTNLDGPNAAVVAAGGPRVDNHWFDDNSRSDERNSFFHLTIARERVARHLPDTVFLDELVGVKVNHAAACNAAWTSGPVFARAGCSYGAGGELIRCCGNTGEIADIIYHEYGHGIDGRTSGIYDTTSSEAIADIVAFHITRAPLIGRDYQEPRFLRGPVADPTAARDVSSPVTAENVARRCIALPACLGPLGYLCHCEAMIFAGAAWDFQRLLREKLGDEAGWDLSEKIHYVSLPLWRIYPGAYEAWLLTDDTLGGDGDITNGTPNGCLIHEAFALHGISAFPAACSDAAPRLRLARYRVDDADLGDGDGGLEPGETVTLRVDVVNAGTGAAAEASARVVSSFPGLSIVKEAHFGPVEPGAEATGTIELALDASVACGLILPLELELEADGTRSDTSLSLRLGRPKRTLFAADFEAGSSGLAAGAGDALEGDSIAGEPTVTTNYGDVFQPEGCARGRGCFFTGSNPDFQARTVGDVDAGVALALLPPVGGADIDGLVVGYRRWFVSLGIEYQPEDVLELRRRDASGWSALQVVSQSRSAWVEDAVAIAPGVADEPLELAFAASDLAANGDNIVEAALDDIKVQAFTCRLDPDCRPSRFEPNSLRALKAAPAVVLSWAGDDLAGFNVYRTELARDIPGLWEDASTVIARVTGTSLVDTGGEAPLFYSVHASDCEGVSLP